MGTPTRTHCVWLQYAHTVHNIHIISTSDLHWTTINSTWKLRWKNIINFNKLSAKSGRNSQRNNLKLKCEVKSKKNHRRSYNVQTKCYARNDWLKTNTWSDCDGLLGDGTRGVRDLGECHEGGLAAEGLRRGRTVGLAGSGATCHPRRCLHSNAAPYLIAQRVLSNQNLVMLRNCLTEPN